MTLIDTPEGARRLARAIVSDIRIYNEPRVSEGSEKDRLLDLLAEELEDGRQLLKSRVQPGLHAPFYDHAIVDVLVYQSRRIRSWIW
jgi:hypothetical protein